MSDAEADAGPSVCTFRRVGKKKGQVRQRTKQASPESEGNEDREAVNIVRKKRRLNPMVQSTKKESTKVHEGGASTSESDDEDRLADIVAEHAFAATGSAVPLGPKDQGATATLDIDTEAGKDAQSQFERVQQLLDEGLEKNGKVLYKGQAMYGAKKAKDTAKGNASSGMNRVGPVRAPQFLRQTVRWDFAPDICKDYKETGFCTFGDSCKFLHDRSDYKHGWEIERDYQAGRSNKDDVNYEISSDDDNLPDECQICNEAFVNPVVSKCKHYFCEKCAMTAFRKNKRCHVCNENTGGVFNIAKDVIAKMSGEVKKKKKTEESELSEEGEKSGPEEDTEMQMLEEEDGDGEGDDGESAHSEEAEEEGDDHQEQDAESDAEEGQIENEI